MTTGSTGSTVGQNYEYRTWSGEDGKYEIVNGKQRVKFNNYTCSKGAQWDTKYGPGEAPYWKPYEVSWSKGNSGAFTMNDTVKLQSKLASKIRETDLHIGRFVVEGRQMLDMMVNTLLTVVRAFCKVRNGDIPSAVRMLLLAKNHGKSILSYEVMQMLKRHRPRAKNFAGRWLELQYGWLPLLSDIHAAADKLDTDMNKVLMTRAHSSSSRLVRYEASASPTLYTIVGEALFVQKLRYEFAEDETVSLQRQLGLEDPAGIIWEAVPFSFVVDWFMPVSSYLESLNVLPLLKGRWCLTKVASWSCRHLVVLNGPRMLGYKGATLNAAQIEIMRTHGEGFTFFNVMPPDLKLFSEAASQPHVLNAIALATQLLSGGRPSWR